MSRIRLALCICAIFSFAASFAAAETITLTVDEAVRLALEKSVDMRKSSIDLASAEYRADHLWSEIFPNFSLSAGLTFLPGTNLLTSPGFAYESGRIGYNVNFGVSLSLSTSLGASMRIIELAYRTQLLSYESAATQLEISVIKDFLNLIVGKENISYLEESLSLAGQQLEMDRVARRNGLLSEIALLNSQMGVETARYNLNSARGSYEDALNEFLSLLGIDTGNEIILSGNIEVSPLNLNPETLITSYLPGRPDIVSQTHNIERLKLSRSVTAHTSRAPSLNLSTSWRGGNNNDGFDGNFTDNLSGSLSLSIPIDSWIPGTERNQSIRDADAAVEKAMLDLQNTQTAAASQIRSLVSGMNNTWENIEIARLGAEIAEVTARASEEGFRNGTVESGALEDARNKLTDARQRLLQAEFSYQSMLLDLSAALNIDWRTLAGDLSGGVTAPVVQ